MQTFSLLCATIFPTSFHVDLYLYTETLETECSKLGDSLKSMHSNTVRSFKLLTENMYIFKNVHDY